MAATKFTVTDVFAELLKPVAHAVQAETGYTFSRPQVKAIGRRLLVVALRGAAVLCAALAERIEPSEDVTVEPSAPVPQPAPEPVVTATEPQPAPAPEVPPFGLSAEEFAAFDRWVSEQEAAGVVPPEPTAAPVPFGWDSVATPEPLVAATEPTPEPQPEPAPVVKPSKTRKPSRKSAKATAAPVPQPEPAPAKVWTVGVVAKVLGISERTVKRDAQSGKLVGTKAGAAWTFSEYAVAAYIATREQTATASK